MAALLRLGTPVLCLSARLTPVAIAHLLKVTKASTVLVNGQVARISKEANVLLSEDSECQGSLPSFLEALGYDDLLDPSQELLDRPVPAPYVYRVRHELGAVIMHSSGTTGLPKPISHAPSYLLVYAGCHRLPEKEEQFDFNVSTLPLYHGFGLLAPSLSLSVGMPFVLPPASIIPTAKSTLSALRSVNARSMLSVPSIVEDILKSPDAGAVDTLKGLDFIAIGGAPMKEAVGQTLVSNGVKLLNHWGATEIGAIAPILYPPTDYDFHYLIPREDIGLEFELVDAAARSYRLIGHPQGWSGPFYVQDQLEMHPTDPKQLRILGRTDDLLVLVTGEKVRPTNLERAVAEHPWAKDVLAFGEGYPALGLLVEIAQRFETEFDNTSSEEVLRGFYSFLDKGNSLTDAHGKVTPNMIVFTKESVKPLLRTDKGSLARKANYNLFKDEFTKCFTASEKTEADPLPSPTADNGLALRKAVRTMVINATHIDDFLPTADADSTDFFEIGMDSLQATRLRRAIQNSLAATPSVASSSLALDFVFENSSVDKLVRAISTVMAGKFKPVDVTLTKEQRRVAAMNDMVSRYTEELASYEHLAAEARELPPTTESEGKVVLLTGSTGSLGCQLLHQLSNDDSVAKVICVNRPRDGGSEAARAYQLASMARRGVAVDSVKWDKVVAMESRISQPKLGLTPEQYEEVLAVDHIIHNAWPVDFNRSLSSLEPHIQALCNLVKLCLEGSAQTAHAQPKRILFASSIAVVGHYPDLDPEGPVFVPEEPVPAEATDKFGYPEAKWVCEELVARVNELYGTQTYEGAPLIRGTNVRIGQMTGPEGSGAWNQTEHFPIIVQASQMISALPIVSGSLSWMPVNRSASVIRELLFSKQFQEYYHMENPSRQSWSGLLHNLSHVLGTRDAPLPLIPFEEWLEKVRTFSNDQNENRALKVMNFLTHDFIRMASGTVVLGTSRAKDDSPTMVRSTSIDRQHLEEYCAYWKRVNLLK
ncbi:hypothetical protein BDQ12DRAFT_687165 [Crucibulum laeve]|uniref:Polyketide synthase-like phosphopantetheine-binding domain-containing protein n=1 Tax=Crucibulum laeve TaxID=68775 RepID=A0A5C3LU24_9AGAR|nr:hypothetical protein BDQ12DRAFT_687165 [Crucibulum laeve]